MKIKIIADSLNQVRTGIGNYTYNLLNGLQQIEAGLSLINYEKTENFQTELYSNIFKGRFLETYLWYLFLPLRIKKEQKTVIHNPTQTPVFFSFKNKNIITIHDLSVLKFPEQHKLGRKLIADLFLPRTLKKADKIIAVSQSTKRDLLDTFSFLSEERIKVIHEAANDHFAVVQDDDVLQDCRKRYGLPRHFILYVGTLEPRKNIPRLLRAFSSVYAKKNVPLVICGKKGWKYQEIFKTLQEVCPPGAVIFTGYVKDEDLPVLYNLASIFVYPSLYEGFGLPPLEAMQCGCPVIASNISSLPEVVGDAAITINPLSIQEIKEAIYLLLSDENMRNSYAQKGIQQAKTFSWKKCATETFQLYKELLHEA